MMLDAALVALAVATVVLVLQAVTGKENNASQRIDYDRVVYHDQLVELDRDAQRGLLEPAMADAARLEIARRMMTAEAVHTAPDSKVPPRVHLTLALIIALGVPVGAGLFYHYLGHPDLPGKPYAGRRNDPDVLLAKQMVAFAAQLKEKPDAAGYAELGGALAALHNDDDAAEAYRKATELDDKDAKLWLLLGEVLWRGENGTITPDARDAFVKAYRLDPRNPQARFYLGLAALQNNDPRHAVAIWQGIEKDGPPNAPWMPMIEGHIQSTAQHFNFDPAAIKPEAPKVP
jgi:cytochrome c-type biogenesis protein CcmH